MTLRFFFAGFALVLAGCGVGTTDDASLSSRANGPSGRSNNDSLAAVSAPEPRNATAFASLPDRGDLLGYLPTPPRHEGRSSWHRVDVSEAHAMRATPGGVLRMTAPDGQVLDFRHTRHVEYPDGNWSWIGELTDAPGSQAIITFGERAVFGTFRRPGARPLELTVRGGVAWLVEHDPAAMRGVDESEGPDFLVPRSALRRASAQAAGTAGATAASTPVVDLVLGYTAGFAAGLGGQSQANTRLSHLVTVTNDAYARSRLNAKVRLVRTLQVNYPDNTHNNVALTDLTGSDGQSGKPVPASLQPLRQARDQYGGDLVSLVRKFNDPENAGCGVAWLIGGGGTSYTTSDAPWGYSVVSDGSDGQYYCREETLAHELGHNMGQNHNIEDSGGDSGVHPYSYGYRESSSTGFFTIMAYRAADTQHQIPYFANPSVNDASTGRPTGAVNAADNVRSMMQTMPITAMFRAAVLPYQYVVGDVDGDGKSDLLFRYGIASVPNNVSYWVMNGFSRTRIGYGTMGASYRIATTGDFNGDGKLDIVWTSNNRDVRLWFGDGNGFGGTTAGSFPILVGSYGSGWEIVGSGDVDGDGKSDLLFWYGIASVPNNFSYWVMNGASRTRIGYATMGASYRVATSGDYNGDGKLDIAWTSSNRDVRLWFGDGTSFGGTAAGTFPVGVGSYGSGWEIVGSGDVDGDGKSDLLFRYGVASVPNNFSYWVMNGASRTRIGYATMGASYRIATTGDFNGDNKIDLAWTSNNRDVRIWFGDGNGFGGTMPGSFPVLAGTYGSGWEVVRVGR